MGPIDGVVVGPADGDVVGPSEGSIEGIVDGAKEHEGALEILGSSLVVGAGVALFLSLRPVIPPS